MKKISYLVTVKYHDPKLHNLLYKSFVTTRIKVLSMTLMQRKVITFCCTLLSFKIFFIINSQFVTYQTWHFCITIINITDKLLRLITKIKF